MGRVLALAAAALISASAAGAQPASRAAGASEKPEAFLRRLYALYPLKPRAASPAFRAAGTWFAPPLLDLLRQDEEAARRAGDGRALDFDPVCACQDDMGFSGLVVTVDREANGEAEASARFRLSGPARTLRYRLVQTRSGWRIADIASPEVPSLLAFMRTALAP